MLDLKKKIPKDLKIKGNDWFAPLEETVVLLRRKDLPFQRNRSDLLAKHDPESMYNANYIKSAF